MIDRDSKPVQILNEFGDALVEATKRKGKGASPALQKLEEELDSLPDSVSSPLLLIPIKAKTLLVGAVAVAAAGAILEEDGVEEASKKLGTLKRGAGSLVDIAFQKVKDVANISEQSPAESAAEKPPIDGEYKRLPG